MLEGRSQARKQQGLSDAEGERREAMRCGVMMLPMSIHAKEVEDDDAVAVATGHAWCRDGV
jgi:hypothetical protein